MNFLKSVGTNLGNLLLDSDSDSDSEDDRRDASGAKSPRGSEGSEDQEKTRTRRLDDDDDDDDEPLIPDAVWGALASARGKLAEVAKSTVDTVRRDLSEFREAVREDVHVVGESLSEHVEQAVHDAEFRDGIATTAHDAFEATTDALEEVGQKVEHFGSSVFRGAGELFAQVKEAVDAVEASSSSDSAAWRFRNRDRLATKRASGDKGRRLGGGGGSERETPTFEQRVQTMQRDSGGARERNQEASRPARARPASQRLFDRVRLDVPDTVRSCFDVRPLTNARRVTLKSVCSSARD